MLCVLDFCNGFSVFSFFLKHFNAEALCYIKYWQVSQGWYLSVSELRFKKSDSFFFKHLNNKFKYDAGLFFTYQEEHVSVFISVLFP